MRENVYYIISGIFLFFSLITGGALICSPDIILGIICGLLFSLSSGFCRWAIYEDALRARQQREVQEVKTDDIKFKIVKKKTIQDRLNAI